VRIASICSGAFILAATGLLDGRRATTHWGAAAELARRYPRVTVDPNVLFVDEGQFLTSAGASAGLDLCLHLVRCDYGAAVAAHAARLAVVPLLRDGGQAQYIVQMPPRAEDTSLARVLSWAEKNLDKPIALQDIAKRAAMSVRSLNRHFKQQLGLTPLHWLIKARVHRAQVLLETTALSIDAIASSTGFGSASTLRTHFQRVAGTSPQAYRKAFRGAA
jgi:transcriptional regulator GlxA family with amidase domain